MTRCIYLNFDGVKHRTFVGYSLTLPELLSAAWDFLRLAWRHRRPRFVLDPRWPPR